MRVSWLVIFQYRILISLHPVNGLLQQSASCQLHSQLSMVSTSHEVLEVAEKALQCSDMAKKIRTRRSASGQLLLFKDEKTVVAKKSERKKPHVAKSLSITNHCRQNLSYESALGALKAYHSIHNDVVLPRRFKVPTNDPSYPTEWHGIDLSSTVYNMNWWKLHIRQYPDRVAELNRLGFIWERLQPEWNLILGALITYSSINGNLLVPVNFVVPRGQDIWPKATWGICLGKYVYRMRIRNDFLKGPKGATRRSQLDGLGFVWDMGEYSFDKFLAALQHFATFFRRTYEEGPLKVPSTFEVPIEDQSWPRELWGYPLGSKCSAVRQKGLYVKGRPDRQEQLSAIGFCWEGNASLGWHQVVHAAAIYSQMNNRNLNVPIAFRVPSPNAPTNHASFAGSDDAWPWPEHLWNFPLGQRLKDIRLKGAYLNGTNAAKRRAQLDALGFEWNPKRGRRKKTISSP
mmetsp:Transcript_7613/g.11068  ORF Transcript_7613/g.11068 Transcript_7613/m.11068 type:complete len:459 (+) Transcript_7613:160-1536(+)